MAVDLDIQPPESTATSTPPPQTRHPLPQEAHGSLAIRTSTADEATCLEVDHMILDFFLHDAIQTCLSTPHSIDSAIRRVDDFLSIFNDRHPTYSPDPELHFRQLLLQLLTLITNRYEQKSTTPPLASLIALRDQNISRARKWIASSAAPTFPYPLITSPRSSHPDQTALLANTTSVLASLNRLTTSSFYGSQQSVSLVDLLPMFMDLSAVVCGKLVPGGINDQWMKMASEWMLQACLEQFFVYGATNTEFIDEAFAWGWQRKGEGVVNAMFRDEEVEREVEGWEGWKERRLDALMREVEGEDFAGRLERLAVEYSMKQFEETVRGFLEALGQCISEPVLLQLQKGKLQDMSEADTAKFLKECGVAEVGLAEALQRDG